MQIQRCNKRCSQTDSRDYCNTSLTGVRGHAQFSVTISNRRSPVTHTKVRIIFSFAQCSRQTQVQQRAHISAVYIYSQCYLCHRLREDMLEERHAGQLRTEDRAWHSISRRSLHQHYSTSILDDTINRPDDGLHAAINRAIAGKYYHL